MVDSTVSPIFITGIPRSGTSMIAGVLQIAGVFLGEVTKPEKHSPRGMFENRLIHDVMVEPYLKEACKDTFGHWDMPDIEKMSIPTHWQTLTLGLMEEQGYDKKTLWGYKSNKLALLWPVWDYAFPYAKWIIVRRRSGDIADSCLSTSYMKAFKDSSLVQSIGCKSEREAWLWMIHQYEKRFVQMIERGLDCKVVWPERMVNGDYSQLYETLDWIGLKWSTSVLNKILEYIDPKFWKVRR